MKKKGFTLIELLAVVIILAVVAIVSTPIVLDVIDDARSNANKESAYGIVKAGEYYYAESMLDVSKKYNVENINDIYDQITVSGEKPSGGKLYVNNKGQVAMSVTIGNNCYVKDFYSEVQELDSNDENCDLGYVSTDEVNPKVEISILGEASPTGWYTESPYIHIKVDDLESGISNYRWCQGMNCDAANSENVETELEKNVLILDNVETQLCVVAYDKANNSTIKCSDPIKVDTVEPEFSGIMADSNIPLNQAVDLITGVEVKDVTSGINGTYKILNSNDEEITSIDTTKSGVHEIRYVVTDNAGNETITTVKIEVSGTAPTITYTTESGVFNENGWANKDFIVTINVTDNSGHGIDSFNVCTATSDTCDPSKGSTIEGTTGAREIVQEDSNNRICVSVTDKSGKTSTLCSSAYKLDKTAPTAGTIKVNGSNEIKDWYTEDVTIEVVEGSDSLSGHLSTTSNITSVTDNTKGTVITVTTKDNAGNTSTAEYTVKIDKTLPTCTFTTLTYLGINKTGAIELTCTNNISGISDKELTASDFTVNNAEITNVSKSSVTNGYKYTITVKGTESGTFAITLPAGKVTTEAGLGNTAKTSGNTIVTSLEITPETGTTYVNGDNLTATVSQSNTGSLSCASQNSAVATCTISGTTLTVTPVGKGETNIIVTESSGGATASYTVTVKEVTLGLTETTGTVYVGGNNITTTITGSNYNNLSCISSDTTKATCTISGTTLTVVPVSQGEVTITVTEENANQKVKVIYTATVIKPTLALSSTSGTIYVGGTTSTVTITSTNAGSISCESSKPAVATCEITGNTLTVVPVSAGTSTITVKESNGNVTASYTATVIKPTLALSSTSGTLYNGGSNKTVSITGTDYGTLTCSSSNESYAACTISGTTLTIIPGNTEGTATITVKESNGNVTTSYTATNKIPSISLNPTSGTTYIGGSNLTSTITKNESAGSLSCTSSNENVAKCTISGTTLTMTPQATSGSAVITIKEANGNKTATYAFNNMDPEYPVNVTFNPNSKDWTNGEFYVTVTVNDPDGKLSSFNVCTGNGATCDPKTGTNKETITGVNTASRLIATNGVNKVCIQAKDTLGRESGVYCSGEYKLDTVAPGKPTITRSDYNTFTYNATDTVGVTGYYVSTSATKPTTSSTWVTTKTYDISAAATYYVWARDAAGNISEAASITSYQITRSQGTGTSLTTKYESSSGTAFTSTTYVLSGTPIYVSASANTGYTLSTLKHGTTSMTSGTTYTVSASEAISSTATLNQYNLTLTKGTGISTIYYKVNGASSYSSTTSSTTIKVNYGSTYYVYATANAGYAYTTYTSSSPLSGTMGTSGATYAPSATTCSAGTYCTGGSSAATTCPAGSYCPASSTKATSCPSGYTSAAGSDAKSDCTISVTAGKYIATADSSTQTACTAGYYCPGGTVTAGSTGIRTQCPAGSYCPASSTKATACPSGYTSAAGSDAKTDCTISVTAGKYIATADSSTQTACTAGYYCPGGTVTASSTGIRTQCPAGSYCPASSTKATACPSGYTSAAGSDAKSDCTISVTAGKYIATADSSTQTACTAGYYCPGGTVTAGSTGPRTQCPSGYTSPASSTKQSDCYKTITITYAGNGATSGSTASSTCNINYGGSSCSITLRGNGFTRTNYNFQGWGTTTSSVSHNAGSSYNFSSNTTLNAIWKAAVTTYYADGTIIYFNPVTGVKCSDYTGTNSKTLTRTGCLKWYAFGDSETGKSELNLLLDHNTSQGGIKWNANNNTTSGPDSTFLNELKTATDSWVGVPARTDSYTLNNGMVNYTINYNGYRARLITAQELADINGRTWDEKNNSGYIWLEDKKEWLYDRTLWGEPYSTKYITLDSGGTFAVYSDSDSYSGYNNYGYYTATAQYNSTNSVWVLRGDYERTVAVAANSKEYYGIRPVITIEKYVLK